MAKSKRRNINMPNCRGRWDDAGYYAALVMRQMGKDDVYIARELNTSPPAVARNLERGPPSQVITKRKCPVKCTREKKLRCSILKKIAKEMTTVIGVNGRVVLRRTFPYSNSLGAEVVRRGAKPVTNRQIRHDLHTLGLSARRRPRGPRRYKQDPGVRVKFAKDTLREAQDPSLEWIFSDEKKATIQDGQVLLEYVSPGEAPTHRPQEQAPPCVHIWGAISTKGWRKLIVFSKESGYMNEQKYIDDVIEPIKRHLTGANRRFVQDGAKCHTSLYAYGSLELMGIHYVPDWPARSPDLNPQENIWSMLMRRVQTHNPTSEDELRHWLPIEFNRLTREEIRKCAGSFPDRLHEVIRTKGQTIKTKLGSEKP